MLEQIETLQQNVQDIQSRRSGASGYSSNEFGGLNNFNNMDGAGSSFHDFNNTDMDGVGTNRQASGGQFWKNMRGSSYQANRRRF